MTLNLASTVYNAENPVPNVAHATNINVIMCHFFVLMNIGGNGGAIQATGLNQNMNLTGNYFSYCSAQSGGCIFASVINKFDSTRNCFCFCQARFTGQTFHAKVTSSEAIVMEMNSAVCCSLGFVGNHYTYFPIGAVSYASNMNGTAAELEYDTVIYFYQCPHSETRFCSFNNNTMSIVFAIDGTNTDVHTVTNCNMVNNVQNHRERGFLYNFAYAKLTNCVFTDNKSYRLYDRANNGYFMMESCAICRCQFEVDYNNGCLPTHAIEHILFANCVNKTETSPFTSFMSLQSLSVAPIIFFMMLSF